MADTDTALRPGDHIVELGLLPRSYNALTNSDITTIGQLTKLSVTELAALKGLGATSLADILHTMEAAGLDLLAPPEPAEAEPAQTGTSIPELKAVCHAAYSNLLTAQIRFQRAEAMLQRALADELAATLECMATTDPAGGDSHAG